MLKDILLVLLFIFLISLGYYFNFNVNDSKHKGTVQQKVATPMPMPMIEEQIKHAHPQSDFKMEETGKDTLEEIEVEEIEHKTIDIFEEESIDDIKTIIEPMSDVMPVGALRMQKGMIANIKVGDTLLLPSIDGINYELKITHHSVSKTGNVSLDGRYVENDVVYRTILTEGNNAAFISMMAPTGTYEIELQDGIGYIYAVADIENAMIDYSQSDVMEELTF